MSSSTSSTSSTPAPSVPRASLYRQYSRGSSNGSSVENLPPRTLSRVAREVRDLHLRPPEGIKLVVDGDTGMPSNLGELVAEIEGPQGTPYEKKSFQLKLVLGSDFPSSPPRGFFLTKIYHPNVDMSTGAICVNTLKKDWTSSTTFSHVLSVIRCLLIVPFPESSLNDEAGKLFMDSYDEYYKRAHLLADVHGKTASPGTNDKESSAPMVSKKMVEQEGDDPARRTSREKTSNPLSSKNSNSIKSSSGKSSGGTSSKGSSSRMTKKKSLKRL